MWYNVFRQPYVKQGQTDTENLVVFERKAQTQLISIESGKSKVNLPRGKSNQFQVLSLYNYFSLCLSLFLYLSPAHNLFALTNTKDNLSKRMLSTVSIKRWTKLYLK